MELVVAGVAIFLLTLVGIPLALFVLIQREERKAVEHLRANGIRCTGYVRSFRRVSKTQHRVLVEIQYPSGSVGREYVLSGLSHDWLADVCARALPVRVCALPDSRVLAFD